MLNMVEPDRAEQYTPIPTGYDYRAFGIHVLQHFLQPLPCELFAIIVVARVIEALGANRMKGNGGLITWHSPCRNPVRR
jgi:hypothetical protein